jgi:hypothetical protein
LQTEDNINYKGLFGTEERKMEELGKPQELEMGAVGKQRIGKLRKEVE